MNFKNVITSKIFKDILLSKEEIENITTKLKEKQLKKSDILLHAESTVYNQYYVLDGCLRTYFIDTDGKEHTLQFAIKDWWISDYTAFFNTSKAVMHIECIQDAILYEISKENMEILFKEVPKIETFFRKKMEKAFSRFQNRILSNLAMSAKERYLAFVQTYPNIEQSVKNYHVASYLGIATESLSRIRKEIATK